MYTQACLPLPTSSPVSSAWLQRRPCRPGAWKLSPRGPAGPWRSHRSPALGAAPARRHGAGLVSQRAGGCADGVVETHPLARRVAQPAPPSHSSLAFSPQEGKAGIPPLKRLHLLSPHTQSCSKSPGFRRQARVRRGRAAGGSAVTDWGAERAPSISARARPPRARTPHPTPTHCPRGSRPIRGRARGAAGGQTLQLPGLRPGGHSPAAASRPGHTHRPGRALRAPLCSGPAFPGSALLRSGSRSGSGSRSSGLGSEMVAAAASEAGRACACVYVCARAACACAREGPALPCAPHSCLLLSTLRCQQNP